MAARRSIRLVWLILLIALLACGLTVGLPTSDDESVLSPEINVNRLTDFNRLAYSDDSSSKAADSSELNTVFEDERGEETAAQRKCPYGSSSINCALSSQEATDAEAPAEDPVVERTKSAWIEELLAKADNADAAADLVQQIRRKKSRSGLHSLRRACQAMCPKCVCGVILLTPTYSSKTGKDRMKGVAASIGASRGAKKIKKGAKKKAGKKVKKGAKKAGKKVKKGAKKAGKKAKKGAKKTGKKVKKGAKKVKKGKKKVGKKVKKDTKKAEKKFTKGAKRVEEGAKKAGKEISKNGKTSKSGHKSGYKSGHKSGYKSGHKSGHKSGYKSGHKSGYGTKRHKHGWKTHSKEHSDYFERHSAKTSATGESSKSLRKFAGRESAGYPVEKQEDIIEETSPDLEGNLAMKIFFRY